MAFAEMTEVLNRVWENLDSRSPALLQLDRRGLVVEVDPRRKREVFELAKYQFSPICGGDRDYLTLLSSTPS